MRLQGFIIGALVVSGLAQPAFAERASRTLAGVATIEDREGHARILVHLDPSISAEHYVIGRATVKFDLVGEADERAINLNVHPVTTAWNAGTVTWTRGWRTPGGDFDENMLAATEIQLSRGAHTVALDVTQAVKEILENDGTWNGLIVTTDPRDGDGIDSDDLSRFSGLENATVELTWRKVPPKPRELAEAPGAEKSPQKQQPAEDAR